MPTCHFRRLAVLCSLSIFLTHCGKPVVSAIQDKYSGSEFYVYTKEDRIKVIKSLADALENRYSAWDLKRSAQRDAATTLPLKTEDLFANAIAAEAAIEDTNDSPLAQSKQNLDYLDRIRQIVGQFRDTHMDGVPYVDLPKVTTGLGTALVEGRVIVKSKSVTLLQYVQSQSNDTDGTYNDIAVGDVIVDVDGVPAVDAVKNLVPYLSHSSDLFGLTLAAGDLLDREYRYPTKPFVDVTLMHLDDASQTTTRKMRLPWFYVEQKPRRDAVAYLKAVGIEDLAEVLMSWDGDKKKWGSVKEIEVEGFHYRLEPKGMVGATTYSDYNSSSTKAVLRTGFMIKAGRSYGVIQLLSFRARELTNIADNEHMSLVAVVENFVSDLAEKGTPLIIDLRANGGGDGTLPAKVLRPLLPKSEKPFPVSTSAIRVTRYMRIFLESSKRQKYIDPEELDSDEIEMGALNAAIGAKDPVTRPFMTQKHVSSPSKVLTLPIVAITGPHCISACDMFAYLLKQSGAATLIGQPTNGTGAGYLSRDDFDATSWSDDFNILKINMPNFLFGAVMPENADKLSASELVAATNLENRPTVPHIVVEPRADDYTMSGFSIFNRAIDEIEERRNEGN